MFPEEFDGSNWTPFAVQNDKNQPEEDTWADYEEWEIATLRNVTSTLQITSSPKSTHPGMEPDETPDISLVIFHEDKSRVIPLSEFLFATLTYESDYAENRIVALTKLRDTIDRMMAEAKQELIET